MAVLFLGLFICFNLLPRSKEPMNLNPTDESPTKPQSVGLFGLEAFLTSQSCQRRAAIFARKTKSSLVLNLLLLCGDININPGPAWKFPCGHCKKPVKCNQLGIQCHSCDSWLHVRCLERILMSTKPSQILHALGSVQIATFQILKPPPWNCLPFLWTCQIHLIS